MTTLTIEQPAVQARTVTFSADNLTVVLSDERTITLPYRQVRWLQWLAKATPQQRQHWEIEPTGDAIWWPELDDGIEVIHLLSLAPVTA